MWGDLMKYNQRINRIKLSLYALFFVSFFIPVYAERINGTLYKASIVDLNAGLFFIIFFLVIMITTIVLFFVNQQYFKIAYLVTSGFMVILLGMLLFLKQNGSSLRLAFYLEFIFVFLIILSHFNEALTFKLLDTLKAWIMKMYQFVKKYIILGYQKAKEKIQEKKNQKEEGDIDEKTA